jgi:hypothetical protein
MRKETFDGSCCLARCIYDMMMTENLPNFMTQVCSSNGKYSASEGKGKKKGEKKKKVT